MTLERRDLWRALRSQQEQDRSCEWALRHMLAVFSSDPDDVYDDYMAMLQRLQAIIAQEQQRWQGKPQGTCSWCGNDFHGPTIPLYPEDGGQVLHLWGAVHCSPGCRFEHVKAAQEKMAGAESVPVPWRNARHKVSAEG